MWTTLRQLFPSGPKALVLGRFRPAAGEGSASSQPHRKPRTSGGYLGVWSLEFEGRFRFRVVSQLISGSRTFLEMVV